MPTRRRKPKNGIQLGEHSGELFFVGQIHSGFGEEVCSHIILDAHKGKVSAVLDLGGGATSDRIKEAIRILLSTPGAKALLINIFGGITRCDSCIPPPL